MSHSTATVPGRDRWLGLATAAGALLLWLLAPAVPELLPDSGGYVDFAASRTAAYPLFIDLVGLDRLVAAQIGLFAAAAGFLAIQVARLAGHWLAGAALIAALFANPAVNLFHHQVVTESVTLSLLCLQLGLVCAHLRGGRMAALLLAALAAGVAAAVRLSLLPVGLSALLPLLPALRARPWQTLGRAGLIVGCWLAPMLASSLYQQQVHGARATSLTGQHLYAKASLIAVSPRDRAGLDPLRRALHDGAERDYAAVRATLARADGTRAYPVLRTLYEECLQHACSNPLRAQAKVDTAAFNAAMADVGLDRIARNPGGLLGLFAEEYVGLWSFYARAHPRRAGDYDAAVARLRPLPFREYLADNVDQPTAPARIAWVVRPAFAITGLAVTLALPALFVLFLLGRLRAPAQGAMYAAAAAVAVSVLTALMGIGIARYTLGLWPLLAAFWVLAAAALLLPRPGT